MALRLRDHLHWCDCSGRAVFLDLAADRYFCLGPHANQVFLAAARGGGDALFLEQAPVLTRSGILVGGGGRVSIPAPPAIGLPSSDYMPADDRRWSLLALIHMLGLELRFERLLRTRPLREAIDAAAGSCATIGKTPHDQDRTIQRIVGAAAGAALISRSHNRCLVRALAVQSACVRQRVGSKLVIGVIANPFAAHSWVQLGNQVLVGGFEQARLYTPILVTA